MATHSLFMIILLVSTILQGTGRGKWFFDLSLSAMGSSEKRVEYYRRKRQRKESLSPPLHLRKMLFHPYASILPELS